ncbi:MAG TPA: sugar phosphate nucleotidyltransferase [Saprospiraceae bacterium]|nr:sugar phosphate nucleotidyltransferase [Saprospiraceae bacterium]
MKIIIPMAGRGSRLRPHTLTIPKPMQPVAGKPIVQRIVEDFDASFPGGIEEVAFIIGDFGAEVEQQLTKIAKGIGAKASIYQQEVPLGPAHAIQCAKDSLEGKCIVAFADTLFNADFSFDTEQDGMIWVQKVADPSSFGVVKLDDQGVITDFVEKSPTFVSDLAIVGIYYFKDGAALRDQIQHLIDNDIKDKGEFQITSVLDNMKAAGTKFRAGKIDEWLDCGNKENIIATTSRILELKQDKEQLIADSLTQKNSQIIPPCYIGENVQLENSVVGPFAVIDNNSVVKNSVIQKTIVQQNSQVTNANLRESMIGNEASYEGHARTVSVGDYSQIAE